MGESLGARLAFEQHVQPPMHELVKESGGAIGQCNAITIMKVCFMLSVCSYSSHDMWYIVICFKPVQRKVCYVFKE